MKSAVSPRRLQGFLSEALKLMRGARRLILKKRAQGYSISTKPDASFVTDADTAVENLLRQGISRRFPDHGIIGEEFPKINPASEFQWILDPIDGTLSFIRGIPLYGSILALHHQGRPLLGVIDHPSLGLCYSAGRGLGARLNGNPLRVKGLDIPWAQEVIAASDRLYFQRVGKEKAFDRLMRAHSPVRTYSDCFGHTLAFEGAVGAVADFGVKIWDIAASQVIIEEAGGRFVLGQKIEKPGHGTLYGVIFGKPQIVERLCSVFGVSRKSRAPAGIINAPTIT